MYARSWHSLTKSPTKYRFSEVLLPSREVGPRVYKFLSNKQNTNKNRVLFVEFKRLIWKTDISPNKEFYDHERGLSTLFIFFYDSYLVTLRLNKLVIVFLHVKVTIILLLGWQRRKEDFWTKDTSYDENPFVDKFGVVTY